MGLTFKRRGGHCTVLSTRTDLTSTLMGSLWVETRLLGLRQTRETEMVLRGSGGERRHTVLYGRGRGINGDVSRVCFTERTSPEPDLEGQRGLAKVEESGEVFQDMVVLEAKVSVACPWDNDIGPVRARQASLSDWREIRYIR